MTGTVNTLYEPAMRLNRAGVIPGFDMTSEAALSKLLYLLALPGSSFRHVTEQMSISLRGELTEQTRLIFEHPEKTIPTNLAKEAALNHAIAAGNVSETEDLINENLGCLNEKDYAGNTPLHIAATGPNIDILQTLLMRGASVHLRNKEEHTPLFLAARTGLAGHVTLLRQSGAHLHTSELDLARLHSQHRPGSWAAAGI